MAITFTNKLILINSVISSYFFVLYCNTYYLKFDFVLVGVIQELLTIPFLLAQPIFFVISIRHLFTVKNKILLVSVILLAIVMILTVRSFITP